MSAAANNTNRRFGGGRAPPALNPENPALTQPWREFISQGWIKELSLKYTPMGTTIGCLMNTDLFSVKEQVPIGQAKSLILEKGLWKPGSRPGSKTNPSDTSVPKKSLTKEDFKAEDAKLKSRAKAVATALGDSTAIGRIGSLRLYIRGVSDFAKWWASAKPSGKARLLTDERHYKELSQEDKKRLATLLVECPFRGSVPTPPQEEEEQEDKDA